MTWNQSMGPKTRNEPFFGICPQFNRKAKISATYTGKQMAKTDIALTYQISKINCSLIPNGKNCPNIEGCPFVPKYL